MGEGPSFHSSDGSKAAWESRVLFLVHKCT